MFRKFPGKLAQDSIGLMKNNILEVVSHHFSAFNT
jgi:hypothetical protein